MLSITLRERAEAYPAFFTSFLMKQACVQLNIALAVGADDAVSKDIFIAHVIAQLTYIFDVSNIDLVN